MERTDITYFFENFCKKNVAAFKDGNPQEVRRDCRFLNELAGTFPASSGASLTNYTQIFNMDIEWTRPMNHQFAINGICQYFGEHYDIFMIIKYILTSDVFITQEHHDALVAFTKGDQVVKYIYTYLINKQLWSIYKTWNIDKKYCKDASMIHNKIAEIYGSHNIQGNFPDIQQITNNPSWLEPSQSWRAPIMNLPPKDDFLAYMKIWRFLSDYMVMMRGYSAAPVTKLEVKEKKKPETETLVLVEEKKKKKPIPVALKRKVWAKWMGEDMGKAKCLCCKLTDITQLNFHCGHIVAEAVGGELKVDNLKPICQSCNSSMGTTNMDEFISKYGF